MRVVEFWPDYGPGPLWLEGRAVEPESLGVADDLALRLKTWNAAYQEVNIPLDGPGDQNWLAEGEGLLRAVREAIGPDVEIVVTEPWWGEGST